MQLCHFLPANDLVLFPEMDSSSKKFIVIFSKMAAGPNQQCWPNLIWILFINK